MATNTNPNARSKPTMYLNDKDEVKKVFARFDANGDGKISATELADVMKVLRSDTSPEEISRIMVDIDTDCDGFINLEEFANFCDGSSNSNNDGGAKELREAFELYDVDKNGLISAAELHKILIQLGEKCSVQDCLRMIQSVDSDGDGNVSFEEFKKMMTNTDTTSKSASK